MHGSGIAMMNFLFETKKKVFLGACATKVGSTFKGLEFLILYSLFLFLGALAFLESYLLANY